MAPRWYDAAVGGEPHIRKVRPVDDPVTRARVLRDARHMADASETAFELSIDRAMHTRWEDALTPRMRPVRRKWRAPGTRGAPPGNPAPPGGR
jgi:hypothetical protein